MLRILAVTNMYPTLSDPTLGTFVERQIKGLRQIGLIVKILVIERVSKGMIGYVGIGRQIRIALTDFQADIVHSMYGGVMADLVTRAVKDRPMVVSFCGDDLLGELLSGAFRRIISKYGIL